ncbi:MAG: thioredoxin family protein [Proteobacteria bacterium]|nr:thioredoxin family protein [Pseudomonadota bacterium]
MSGAATEPTREEVDAMQGPTVVEFGASWCPHCTRVQPAIAAALARHPDVRHLKIEDGKGRRLGRSFRVKLWPTLIFMKSGNEITRLVRPTEPESIIDALDEIDRA